MKTHALIPVVITAAMLAASAHAELVGSLQTPLTAGATDQQTYTSVTRTSGGNLDTQGVVEGTINIMNGQEVGVPDAAWLGLDVAPYSFVTQYNDLNRYGNDFAGGLISWDFDLGSYLTGKTVGNGVGETQFSLNVDFTNRRTSGGYNGLWYVSYNGGGLTLDTTDITTMAVGAQLSGTNNFNLVSNTSLYDQVLSLAANAGSGVVSVDLTSQLSTIAAGDGLIRIAYLEREFKGDIRLQNESGLIAIVVPEPSTLSLFGLLGCAGLFFRNRCRK